MRTASRTQNRWLAALAAALLAGAAYGEPLTLRLDPAKSRVRFTLDALAHTIHGSLRVARGELRFDPAAGSAAGEVVVDARSAETGNSSRDRKMHQTVLESARFPEIVFAARSLKGAFSRDGESQLTLQGTLSLHGASHPVTLAVRARAQGGSLSATAPLAVPFVEWGLEDPSNLLLRVGKLVSVELEAHGTIE